MGKLTASQIDFAKQFVYLDPLAYLPCSNYDDPTHRTRVLSRDFCIELYVSVLDQEIFDEITPNNPEALLHFEEENHRTLFKRLMDLGRGQSWACVQFYNAGKQWRIFSEGDRVDWLYDKNQEIIGVKVKYAKPGGKYVPEELLYFGRKQCYLYKFAEGNGKEIFAFSDITRNQWTIAAEARQIKYSVQTMAVKPEFKWVKYGKAIDPTQRTSVIGQMDIVDPGQGIGASGDVIEDIKSIPWNKPEFSSEEYLKKIGFFAGTSRLPLSYYLGERSKSNLGDSGEIADMLKIYNKKIQLFRTILPVLKNIYLDRYKIIVDNAAEDFFEKPKAQQKNQDENIDGKNRRTDSQEESDRSASSGDSEQSRSKSIGSK